MKALPSLNNLYSEKKTKGLHIFIVYAQAHPREEVEKFLSDKGCKVPCPYTGSDFSGYRDGWEGLPYGFVIGPDAKVVWEGRSGYEGVIQKQLERIQYPGLGKLEVAPELVKSATNFGAGNYAAAREEAMKVKEKEADNAAVVEEADYIIKRVEDRVAGLRTKIDAAKDKKRYHEALAMLDALASKAYKGMPESEAAATEAKELRKDKAVKEELKAWDALTKTLEANEKLKSNADRKKALIKFWEKYEGMAAAEEARALADAMGG